MIYWSKDETSYVLQSITPSLVSTALLFYQLVLLPTRAITVAKAEAELELAAVVL